VAVSSSKKKKKGRLCNKDSKEFHKDLLDNEDEQIANIQAIIAQEKAAK